MAPASIARPRPPAPPEPGFAEYSRVTLPLGAEGVIVHDHVDGSYSVEFETPSFEVVTIYATELKAVA